MSTGSCCNITNCDITFKTVFRGKKIFCLTVMLCKCSYEIVILIRAYMEKYVHFKVSSIDAFFNNGEISNNTSLTGAISHLVQCYLRGILLCEM